MIYFIVVISLLSFYLFMIKSATFTKCSDLFCYHNYFFCPKYDGSYKQCTNNLNTDTFVYKDKLSVNPRVNIFRANKNNMIDSYPNKYVLY